MNRSLPLRALAHDDFSSLRQGAFVIEADRYGEKDLLLPDGNYLTLFRRKRLPSFASRYPHARRFTDNMRAQAGETLHRLVASGMPTSVAEALRMRMRILDFVNHLHELGIYFRSCRLGNTVLTPDGQAGLIDVAALQVFRGRLGALKRRRNLRHIFRDMRDRDRLLASPE